LSHNSLETHFYLIWSIVNICSPSGAHLELAIRAAEAGKHLIIEKPEFMSKKILV